MREREGEEKTPRQKRRAGRRLSGGESRFSAKSVSGFGEPGPRGVRIFM